jgi:phage gpG-like protein
MAKGLGFTSYIVDNDQKFQRALELAQKKLKDLTPILDVIGADFLKSRKAIFGLSSPGQYPDLSTKPFIAKWPNVRGYGAFYAGGYKQYKQENFGLTYPILKITGTLEASITKRGAKGNIYNNSNNTLSIGSNIPYGVYHQSDAPRKKIPLRKFLFIGPEAPRFAKGDALKGFPERTLRNLRLFILRSSGKSIEQITGTAPVIDVTPEGENITSGDIK